ncbi:MAG: PAS domain-containing protein [Firmicutes bacterium]|nr:PAS domain-containing protein [Bacillota bacterium]
MPEQKALLKKLPGAYTTRRSYYTELAVQKAQLIEKLTGVYTAKRSYYAELKEKISEITKRNLQLEILSELARQISINTPLEEIVKNVSTSLGQVLPFDRVSLCTFREGKLYLNCFHPDDGICQPGMEIPPEAGRALWHVSENPRQLVWQRDAGIEDRHLARLGLQVAVISPLFAQKRVFGLLCVASFQKTSYDPPDLTFLQQLANQLAIYLQDRELFAEVTRAKIEWEATFKAVKDLIVVVDREMRILHANLAALQFCGLSEEEVLGRKCCEVICASSSPCPECAASEVLRTKETAHSQRLLDDGRVMEFYAYPAFHEEDDLWVVIYIKDITERLKMQAQLLRAARLAALGEMAAGVAHELNTPLAVILGNVQLLLRSCPQDDPKKRLLEDIKTCGLRCKQIVQGLLAFSRQEHYVFHPLSVNDVVREALKLVSYQIETDNIQIDVDLDPKIPQIAGNAQQLEQVVVNLLLNAKQSFEGVGERLRLIGIKTGYDPERNQVFIKVSDTGQGIPMENLTRIFDPFFTSKGVGKERGSGSP